MYAVAISRNITETPEYKECLQLLNFLSKDELLAKLSRICDTLRKTDGLKSVLELLVIYVIEIKQADFTYDEVETDERHRLGEDKLDRAALKQVINKDVNTPSLIF